jgi:orotate phosphoribosyltransferase
VRKESKKHGIGAWVEGMKNVPPPAFVALIEDVVTTGGSALVARDKLVGAGYKVPAVFALVDRLEGARKVIEAEGMKLISIFDRHDFIPEEE